MKLLCIGCALDGGEHSLDWSLIQLLRLARLNWLAVALCDSWCNGDLSGVDLCQSHLMWVSEWSGELPMLTLTRLRCLNSLLTAASSQMLRRLVQ